MKTQKIVQVVFVSAIAILACLMFRWVLLAFIIFGLIRLVAIWRKWVKIANATKVAWHWFLEGAQDTFLLGLIIAKHRVDVRGTKIALGWPISAVLLLSLFGWMSYSYYNTTPVTAIDSPGSPTLPFPIGVDRMKMNDEEFKLRVDKMVQTRQFYLLGEEGAVEGAKKVTGPAFASAIRGASQMYGVEPEYLEAHLYLESHGKEQAKSPTGPIGPAQFTLLTAGNLWKVKGDQFLVQYKGQEADMANNRRRTTDNPIKVADIIKDNRTDLELSVYGEAKLLAELKKIFGGRQDFASAAYHTKESKIKEWIKTYLSPQPMVQTKGMKRMVDNYALTIAKYNLTYDQMFFRTTPYYNPGTYKKYREIAAEDYGATYWYKILCAKDMLALYRLNSDAFKALAEKQRYKGKKASNRMWSFYSPEDDPISTLEELKAKVANKELFPVPTDPRFGFTVRLEGGNSVASQDKPNEKYYIATLKETAGLLLYLGKEAVKLRAGRPRLPIDITAISRTEAYQKKLTKINSAATKALSFHVLGLAFDITRNGMSDQDMRDLQFLLDELDSIGYISWVPENDAYHVVVAPDKDAKAFFRKVFDDATDYQQASQLVISQ